MRNSLLLSLLAPLVLGATQAEAAKKTNILLIVADDCSYYDLGCYGAVNNKTPNIDQLAKDGVLFNRAYNSASMSTPTRHVLYTGMYPIKNQGYANHSQVRQDAISMPVHLGKQGYRVGLAGKWHIKPVKVFPFEEVPGFKKNCLNPDPSYTLDGVKEFITRDPDQPFCLVLASINPHLPWTGGDPSVFDRKKLVLPPQMIDTPATREIYSRYLAEVTLLDKEVGDMIQILKANHLYDDTLILFVSEQGTEIAGAKWTNWNTGVKAGVIARWGSHIQPGTTTDAIVQYEDVLPTFIEVAGGDRPEGIDGFSMLNVLEGKTQHHRDYAFSLHNNVPEGPAYPIRAVTDGTYKLIHNLLYKEPYAVKHIENKEWFATWKKKAAADSHSGDLMNRYKNRPEYELYDVITDPFEMNNLYGKKKYEKKVKELQEQLTGWMKEQNDLGIEMDKM